MDTDFSTKNLTPLFADQSPKLHDLLAKTRYLTRINALFKTVIDPALAPHCDVANIRDNCLIVLVHSPTWAMPFRFQLPDILKKLRATLELSGIQQIIYHVEPPPKPVGEMQHRAVNQREISTTTAQLLKNAARDAIHPALREAFARLARNSEDSAPAESSL